MIFNKVERTEGEYPFLPVKPEHEVLKPFHTIEVLDEETGVPKTTIYYGPVCYQDIVLQ